MFLIWFAKISNHTLVYAVYRSTHTHTHACKHPDTMLNCASTEVASRSNYTAMRRHVYVHHQITVILFSFPVLTHFSCTTLKSFEGIIMLYLQHKSLLISSSSLHMHGSISKAVPSNCQHGEYTVESLSPALPRFCLV